ncbi:HEPN domain-containing protein [Infirmifilum uzonense]|uniref:HEPN domain-containing protein n=1 Tax=Infirmifilum uzonense TaxID=1550241 RepID=UPI00069AC83F|nr:HEPN domain-containing protein [Infirmifilum uzonense]
MKRRALSFLEAAKFSLQKGFYDLAAFNAEQAAQIYLKATLLELIGDYPRTYSLIHLLSELKRVDEKLVDGFIRENKRGLHNLEDAYLTSRYFYKSFDREDGEYLIDLAERVISLCEKLRHSMGKI